MPPSLLEIRDLSVTLAHRAGEEDHDSRVLDGVTITIAPGESVGLIGESGAGKTMLTRAVFRILPESRIQVSSGDVYFKEKSLLSLSVREFRSLLGTRISLLFQEPSQALDPVFTIGDQMIETVSAHVDLDQEEAEALVKDWLRRVGLDEPDRVMNSYPFELSGGMLQRSALAQALVLRPELLVADEPTTALDGSLKVVVLELLDRLRKELKMSLLMVSHDLSAIAWCCEKTMVLIDGMLVEDGPTQIVLTAPAHPYTRELMAAGRGRIIQSQPPATRTGIVDTCPFLSRCQRSIGVCFSSMPCWKDVGMNHRVRCHDASS